MVIEGSGVWILSNVIATHKEFEMFAVKLAAGLILAYRVQYQFYLDSLL